MRRAPLLAALLALASGSGCVRDKGAVLVRWKLIDSSTGQRPADCSKTTSDALAIGESAIPGSGVC